MGCEQPSFEATSPRCCGSRSYHNSCRGCGDGGQCDVGSDGDSTSGVYLTPNDGTWIVKAWDLSSSVVISNVANQVVGNFGSTDLNPSWTPYASNCDPSTDLCIIDGDAGSVGWIGRTSCAYGYLTGSHPNKECTNTTLITLNTYVGSGHPAGVGTSEYNICHETAHSIGLRHFNQQLGITCTRPFAYLSDGTYVPSVNYLHSSEVDEINAHYK